MGYIGQIRGYETTHGRKGTNNGWHPHFHFLQFVMVKGTLRSSWTGKRGSIWWWYAYCQKAGLGSPSFQHGIDLRDGSFANNYVAKWGLEDEMTKGHSKKGKAGRRNTFSTCCAPFLPTRKTSRPLRCLLSSPRLSRANGSCPGRMDSRPNSTWLKRTTRNWRQSWKTAPSCLA